MAKDDAIRTLEEGHVYFFFRPRVEEDDPEGRGDVQRFYMVLHARGGRNYRLAVVGGKRLPDPAASGGARLWGFVDTVTNRPDSIEKALREQSYSTATRGPRRVPAARPAGEGVYRILRHGSHTHLVYTLELPRRPREVQDAFNLEDAASYVLSIRNPEQGSPQAAGLSAERQARYPKRLREAFRDRRFSEADPPEFLDHAGAEFILVAAAEDPEAELGIELPAKHAGAASAAIFRDLRLAREAHPVEPLFEGHWE